MWNDAHGKTAEIVTIFRRTQGMRSAGWGSCAGEWTAGTSWVGRHSPERATPASSPFNVPICGVTFH